MDYRSTRSEFRCNCLDAVLKGIAPDGGLFISDSDIGKGFDWKSVIGLNTLGMAEKILSHLLPDFKDMKDLVNKAYKGKFETDDLTPLVKVGDKYVLELFRGPTSAFKDVALSMLPQLILAAKKQTGDDKETVILTAMLNDPEIKIDTTMKLPARYKNFGGVNGEIKDDHGAWDSLTLKGVME